MRVDAPGGSVRLCDGGAGPSDVLSVRSCGSVGVCSGATTGGVGASSAARTPREAGVALGANAAPAESGEPGAFSWDAAVAGAAVGTAIGGAAVDGAAIASAELAPVACGSGFGGSSAAGTSATRGGREVSEVDK